MNITLSVDDQLIDRVRRIAQASGTSLNQMIRDHLTRIAGEDGVSNELAELRALSGTGSGKGWLFNRDELHERA